MFRRAARFAAALVIVGVIIATYFWWLPVNSTTVALTLLLAILGIASRWGLAEALVAAVAGILCLNVLFLPPIGTLTIADPQNWVALSAFVVTAIVASQLSAFAKRRAEEATARQHEVERLYALSRSLMFTDTAADLPEQLVGHVAQIFSLESVAFFDHATGAVSRVGPDMEPISDTRLRDSAIQGTVFEDAAGGTVIVPVALGGRMLGSLGFHGQGGSESVFRAIANLSAIALERARGQEAASRAEAARQSQELKSTILDSLAHDFKTPLTAIKAAVTSVVTPGRSEQARRELLQVIDEETDRLNVMVTDAVQAARIDAGGLQLGREPWPLAEILNRAVQASASRLEGRDVNVEVASELTDVSVDAGLIGLVLRQLLDNAVKYSPPGTPISLSATHDGDRAVVSIADRGPGVPARDSERVFERLYRGEGYEQVPGTGMGLAIARQVIHAHGGTMAVENRPGGGAIFSFSLPIRRQGER